MDPTLPQKAKVFSLEDRVFVLRVWRELGAAKANEGEWRVRIRDVNKRRQYYADGLERACRLLNALIANGADER